MLGCADYIIGSLSDSDLFNRPKVELPITYTPAELKLRCCYNATFSSACDMLTMRTAERI
jgi:hypothetical protein